MRKNYGLPVPERNISLAAHDFVQAFCANEVFLTRSERVDGAPTVPARWLLRLDTYLNTAKINKEIIHKGSHLSYMQHLDKNEITTPINRPSPTPAVINRPSRLSVTRIEQWLKDPYAIYADKILKLKKLEPLEKKIGAKERGIILHEIMEHFITLYPQNLPPNAYDSFIEIVKKVLEKNTTNIADQSFWTPRLFSLGEWIIEDKANWRQKAQFLKAEVQGEITITDDIKTPFKITARVDRIDLLNDGSVAIIDYKSGGTYSGTRIQSGDLPQLPLEGLILAEGGFSKDRISNKSVGSLSYWKLSGSINKPVEIIEVSKAEQLETSLKNAKAGITTLIKSFEDPEMPYMAIPSLDNAPRYNDYEYLERVKEWAALDDNSEEAA